MNNSKFYKETQFLEMAMFFYKIYSIYKYMLYVYYTYVMYGLRSRISDRPEIKFSRSCEPQNYIQSSFIIQMICQDFIDSF